MHALNYRNISVNTSMFAKTNRRTTHRAICYWAEWKENCMNLFSVLMELSMCLIIRLTCLVSRASSVAAHEHQSVSVSLLNFLKRNYLLDFEIKGQNFLIIILKNAYCLSSKYPRSIWIKRSHRLYRAWNKDFCSEIDD